MVQPKIHCGPEIFFYSTSASPVVPHLNVCRCSSATKGVAFVFSFSQILLISELALECVDNNSVCKFAECSLHSTIQVTNEITEKNTSDLKLFAVIPFGTWVGFDIEQLLTSKTIFRKNMNVLLSFRKLFYLGFSTVISESYYQYWKKKTQFWVFKSIVFTLLSLLN